MEQHSEVFVGLDAAKLRHAVAVAEDGRRGEVRYMGEVGADTESVRRLAAKLEERHGRGLHFCYEAGPTGYGLYRQLTELGYRCTVVAPSMNGLRRSSRASRATGSRPTGATPSSSHACCAPAN